MLKAHRFTVLTLGLAIVVPAAVALSCDLGTGTSTVDPGSVVSAAAGCPNLASVQAAANIDWAQEFGIEPPVAQKIGAGVIAALELDAFATRLDADLKAACGGLATDLGRGGTWNSGTEACQAAIAAVGDARNELTASARIAVNLQPPRCTASMDAMADCAADCDANLEPGQVEVQCEPGKLAGRCDAQCQGTCELQAAARCEGTCQGSCTAEFSGQCGGDCTGTCDGKDVRGASCAGKCEGACSGGAEGRCGGQCKGDCKLSGAAQCQGTCHGSCTAEMKAPRCEGEMTPPKASAECRAQCDARVQGQVECQPAHVAVVVEGAANPQLAAKYAAAIENNLPAVLRIAVGMKDQALGVAGNVKTVVEGVQVAVSQVSAPDVGARLAACVAAPFKSAFDAAASVQANVSVSVDVQASASASASGRAGGSAG